MSSILVRCIFAIALIIGASLVLINYQYDLNNFYFILVGYSLKISAFIYIFWYKKCAVSNKNVHLKRAI